MQSPTISLKGAVNWLENAIITLSGPAIAISGIIAGIDLLTGGSMFKNIGWLSLTWAICLLLTLDFQVLMLGARAKQIYTGSQQGGWKKFLEIVAIVTIAAAISYVSVQMQSIIARSQETTTITDHRGHLHTTTISIDEATKDMGINPVALIWERSSLVLILIFMSGWLRDEKQEPENQIQTIQPADPNYEELAKKVAPLLAPTLDTFKATVLEELQRLVPQPTPTPVVDYEKVAQIVAPLVVPEPLPHINYQEVARNIAPLLRPTFTEVHRTIIEEVRAIIPQLAPAPVTPAPQIGATFTEGMDSRNGVSASFPLEPEPTEETDAQREVRLEAAYQELLQEGKRISGRSLADRARANRKAAMEWLRENHSEIIGTGATLHIQNTDPENQSSGTTDPLLEAIQRQEEQEIRGAGATFQHHMEPLAGGTESTGTPKPEPFSHGTSASEWSQNRSTEHVLGMELVPAGASRP